MSGLAFQKTGLKISETEVAEFERANRIDLPTDYRRFLLETNGGEQPNIEIFWLESGDSGTLRQLFSLGGEAWCSLEGQLSAMSTELPEEFIPIGLDAFGNKLCLCVAGDNRGEVWFRDHEESASDRTALIFVDRSFTDFVLSLRPAETPLLDALESIGKNGRIKDVINFLARGNDMLTENASHRTLVQEAARYGNIEVLAACLDHGATTIGCLHLAAMNNCIHVIDFLLARGVDINEKNASGKTPLSIVWKSETASILRSRGAK